MPGEAERDDAGQGGAHQDDPHDPALDRITQLSAQGADRPGHPRTVGVDLR
ncbi:hypothetical protein Aau02nite_07240 [Amorphoplanes auranticolor]|uniref:Uncharacterized protein n=1 Tax=Actinoplanes auranticolor TaxID=47988 RepID=A0A919VGI0_9ACTN|nr:hypothetical protein Aau02nite_07240 [Actinoplanes auranticolor]